MTRPRQRPARWLAVLPNVLTCSRFALTIVFVWLMSYEGVVSAWLALAVFSAAALTDWLDGWLARRWRLSTPFGIFMDPFADKVLVLSALGVFLWMNLAPVWIVIPIMARDVSVTGLRTLAESRGISIAAIASGKHKMISQTVAILAVLTAQCAQYTVSAATGLPWDTALARLGRRGDALIATITWLPFALLLVALALSIWSGIEFVHRHRKLFVST
ncbi:MAG: CDP-diacylglycerol--glycerol-3-phosphate 3-phosphatidyltransferase [bacterium]